MDPAELRFLIDRSREIWTALRNPKERTAPEEDVYRFARGSVVADRDLPEGHLIGEADIWARRPGSGEIPAYDFDKVVGKRLTMLSNSASAVVRQRAKDPWIEASS